MINSTLCYLERGDAYLMLHRVKKKNDMNHDKWIGVGGKFEEGESPEDCVLRETFEETGLTLTDYRYRGLVTFVSDQYPTEYMHLFTANRWTGESHPCDEGELAWIKKAELLSLPLWEGDKIFLRLLDTDRPFFSLKLKYEGGEAGAGGAGREGGRFMSGKLLLFGFESLLNVLALAAAMGPLGVELVPVARKDYNKPLAVLAGLDAAPGPMADYAGGALGGRMIVLCGLEKQLDTLLPALSQAGAGPDCLKAVLTPHNRGWNGVMLFAELQKERRAFQKGGKV